MGPGRCTDRWFAEEAVHVSVSSASFVLTSQKCKTKQDSVGNSPLMTPLSAQWVDCIPWTQPVLFLTFMKLVSSPWG